MGKNRGTEILKMINAHAKSIRSRRPNMQWTNCVSQATKELKKEGKI